eukprot:355744-Chlamydomonas_euryale.AAC.7
MAALLRENAEVLQLLGPIAAITCRSYIDCDLLGRWSAHGTVVFLAFASRTMHGCHVLSIWYLTAHACAGVAGRRRHPACWETSPPLRRFRGMRRGASQLWGWEG